MSVFIKFELNKKSIFTGIHGMFQSHGSARMLHMKRRRESQQRNMLLPYAAHALISTFTRARWRCEEADESVIRACTNKKTHSLQTWKRTRTCVSVHRGRHGCRAGGRTLDGALKFMCEWKLWLFFFCCCCCAFIRLQWP